MGESSRLQLTIEQFKNQMETLFESQLISILLYGSASGSAYQPKKSDINFLVVLTEEGMKKLAGVQNFLKKWKKQRIAMPLMVTEEYIQNSLDSFPIEFLNMKSSYSLVMGKDVFSNIEIDKKDVRLQCERELKGKLLHLREAFLMTLGNVRAMKQLIVQSVTTFTAIFNGLLFIKDQPIPTSKQETVIAACKEFDEIDEILFTELLKIRSGEYKPGKQELKEKIELYIQQIQVLSQSVDQMKL